MSYPYLSPFIHYQLSHVRQLIALQGWKAELLRNRPFKNRYKGKICFILGTAPSIMDYDLTKISGQAIIAINEIHHHPHFEQIFNQYPENKFILLPPTHATADSDELITSLREMEQKVSPMVTHFLGIDHFKPNYRQVISRHNLFPNHRIHYFRTAVQTQLGWYRFSENHWNLCENIWSSAVGSVYALIVALYMGFDEIYLLGIDHSYLALNDPMSYRFYNPHSNSFKDVKKEIERNKDIQNKSPNSIILEGTNLAFRQYALMAKYTKSKIYNLSNKSILDIFPGKKYEEVIAKIQ